MTKKTALIAATLAACAATAVAQPQNLAQKPPPAPPAPGAPTAADWRTPNPDDVLVIDTNKGRIIVELVPEVAPETTARIRELAKRGFYDGLTFFRVIEGFMAQTGDPQNNGTGASELPDIRAEFFFRRAPDSPVVLADNQQVVEVGFVKSLPIMSQSMMLAPLTADGKVQAWGLYCPGVAGMARGEEPNSANSQFFLMRDRYPKLEKRYTAFGRALAGQDVINAIKVGEPVADPQDRMERVRVLSALPEAERPKIRVIDPAGPWFRAEVARARAAQGSNFSACDVNIPVEVK